MPTGIANYISTLKYAWLIPLYNHLLRRTLHKATFKQALVKQAFMENCQQIPDLGAA